MPRETRAVFLPISIALFVGATLGTIGEVSALERAKEVRLTRVRLGILSPEERPIFCSGTAAQPETAALYVLQKPAVRPRSIELKVLLKTLAREAKELQGGKARLRRWRRWWKENKVEIRMQCELALKTGCIPGNSALQCNNCQDDDNDGDIDFPADKGCLSKDAATEAPVPPPPDLHPAPDSPPIPGLPFRVADVAACPEPIEPQTKVPRAEYLRHILDYYNNQCHWYQANRGLSSVGSQQLAAMREAFVYRALKEGVIAGSELDVGCSPSLDRAAYHRQLVLDFLQGSRLYANSLPGDKCVGFEVAPIAGLAYQWIKDDPALTDENHMAVKDVFLAYEGRQCSVDTRANNRALGFALGRQLFVNFFPAQNEFEALLNAQRLEVVNTVWTAIAPSGDLPENSANYTALALSYLIPLIEASSREGLGKSEFVYAIYEKYLGEIAPPGVFPAYGDAVGLAQSAPLWISLLEAGATRYRDGRFKWAASRMWNWIQKRKADYSAWGNYPIDTMDALIQNFFEFDDSVEPVNPRSGSQLTFRHQMLDSQMLSEIIPDKLMLRGQCGSIDDLYAMFDLGTRSLGHGHDGHGNLVALTSDRSFLISSGTAYLVQDHRFQNAFQVQPEPQEPSWMTRELANTRTHVTHFVDGALMARAVLESTKYRAYEGLSQKRDIVMIKRHSGVDGFLWIIDSLEAAPGRSLSQTAKIGPAWQTWDVHLSGVTDGLEWYVTSLPTLPLAQIWESGFLMQWSNPEKHLFVAWPNLGGAETIVDDVSFDNTHLYVDQPVQNNLKTRIFQARTLPAGESSIARFATLLIPKKFAASSSQLAAGIKFLHEDEPLRIVQLVDESGVILIAGINEQGKKVSLNNVETSAKSFYLRFAADGNLRQFSVSRDGIIDYRGVAINVPSGSGLYEGEIVDES